MADQEKPIARTPGAPRGDHEARRQEITEVAWRVIARDGLEQTSLRAIARELGLSTSIVTHYFKDKEELLLFALDQVQARLTRNLLTGVEKLQGLERLEYLLLEALPIKARATLPWQVWTAYVGYAVGHPKLMAEHRRRATEMRAILVKEIKSGSIWVPRG
jgi:AcrR family transcriptional regulator